MQCEGQKPGGAQTAEKGPARAMPRPRSCQHHSPGPQQRVRQTRRGVGGARGYGPALGGGLVPPHSLRAGGGGRAASPLGGDISGRDKM